MESHPKQQLPQSASKGSKTPTVVLIDDDKRVIELLQIALSGSGYKTFAATDGEQAICLVEKVRPDVVVLDVRLPKKNGYQVCEALRSSPLTHGIPVIMISGLVEPSARVQGLRCGADDFLTKPFSPKELLLRIQKILARASEARSQAIVNAETERELLEGQHRMSRAQRMLTERVERVSAMSEMGRTMAGARSLEELADQLIVSVQLCLRVGTVLIALRDAREAEFKVLKCRGVSSRRGQNIALPVSGELCGRLVAEGKPLTLEELDGVPGMRREIVPLRAAGLAVGSAVDGLDRSAAIVFVGVRRGGVASKAEQRRDFESLCRFFGTGLASIQRAEADKARMVDAVEMLVLAVEKAKRCRGGHSCRVARFVESLWESLDLPPYELQSIRLAALLHEVHGAEGETCGCGDHTGCEGECSGGSQECACASDRRPDGITLDDSHECDADLPEGLLSSLRHFRERYDGSGGPLGLRAEQIPLEARILAVADTFDECLGRCSSTSPVDEAIRSLRDLSGTSLDPNLVEALVHHILNGRVKLG